MAKPELGKVAVGDRLLVIRTNNRIHREPIDAVVVKVGRAWISLEAISGHSAWRMRLDTQDEATGFGYGGDRFVTPAQHEWEQREAEAQRVLSDAMVSVYRGRWGEGERLLALAEFIRTYDETRAV